METQSPLYLTPNRKASVAFPQSPAWNKDRPYLGDLFASSYYTVFSPSSPVEESSIAIGQLPLSSQEAVIIEELLNLLLGFEGSHIRLNRSKISETGLSLMVDTSLNPSLTDLVKKITPLCSYYVNIMTFVDKFSEFAEGMVNQALCAAIRGLLKEYTALIVQLETHFNEDNLTLQKMWFYLQPTIATMKRIESVTSNISKTRKRGGETLSFLYEMAILAGGDEDTRKLFGYLLQKAAVPYFVILKGWIFQGILRDPYNEFMIKEGIQQDYLGDSSWDSKYELRSVPIFLKPIQDTILATGKYFNVIGECGVRIEKPPTGMVVFSLESPTYIQEIEEAHRNASQRLLRLLLEDRQLLSQLRSMKHHFLLSQADHLIHFLDTASEELGKNNKLISASRIQSLFELSLKSNPSTDSFSEGLRCFFSPEPIMEELLQVVNVSQESKPAKSPAMNRIQTGFETFNLDYTAKSPLSLVLNHGTLKKYQFLFRYLFHCKNIERQLYAVWMDQKYGKTLEGASSGFLRRSFFLRQRMISFLQTIQYYSAVEVLEPRWRKLEDKLLKASTIEEVLSEHTDFLDSCLSEFMLTDSDLLPVLNNLMGSCQHFVKLISRFLEIYSHRSQTEVDPSYEKDIGVIERSFHANLMKLLEVLNVSVTSRHQHTLTILVYRLDFNGFYTSGLAF